MTSDKPSQTPSSGQLSLDFNNNSLESSPDITNSSNLQIVSGLILWMDFEQWEKEQAWLQGRDLK